MLRVVSLLLWSTTSTCIAQTTNSSFSLISSGANTTNIVSISDITNDSSATTTVPNTITASAVMETSEIESTDSASEPIDSASDVDFYSEVVGTETALDDLESELISIETATDNMESEIMSSDMGSEFVSIETATAGMESEIMSSDMESEGISEEASMDLEGPVVNPMTNQTAAQSCDCGSGAWLQGVCRELSVALQLAAVGDEISVVGSQNIYTELNITKNTSIQGVICDGVRPLVTSQLNDWQQGIFYMNGPPKTNLSLAGIDFVGSPVGWSRLIHSDELDVDAVIAKDNFSGMPPYTLLLHNISAENFTTQARGGSVIFLQVAEQVYIRQSRFTRNKVAYYDEDHTEYWGGGGTLWFQELNVNQSITLEDTVLEDNIFEYQHGLGGAMTVINVTGTIDIKGTKFIRNQAADGGAIHIARLNDGGSLTIDNECEFDGNIAHEQGWGSRGSALRIEFIKGNVSIDGKYQNNVADGDRALIALNRIFSTGTMTVSGEYYNNTCAKGASIIDCISSFAGKLVIDDSTIFEDNLSIRYPDRAIWLEIEDLEDGTVYKDIIYSEAELQELTADLIITPEYTVDT